MKLYHIDYFVVAFATCVLGTAFGFSIALAFAVIGKILADILDEVRK